MSVLEDPPVLRQGDAQMVIVWAHKIYLWLKGLKDALEAAVVEIKGLAGKDGINGSNGRDGSWMSVVDIEIATAADYNLAYEDINSTIYVNNTSGGNRNFIMPISHDGDMAVIMNRSASGGTKGLTMDFLSSGSPGLILSAGSGIIVWADGLGGWLYTTFIAGAAGPR